jgi:acyl carrier protein
MPEPDDIDPAAFTELLRADKMIADAEVMLGPDTAITAVISPQGLRPSAVLRHRVMRLAGGAGGRVQVLTIGRIPRRPDGALDAGEVLARIGEVYRFEPPVTDDEVALAAIVGEVLPGVPISMTDSVGALGGDSVSTLELMTLIAERFGVEIPAQQVFAADSLRELTAIVQASKTHDG